MRIRINNIGAEATSYLGVAPENAKYSVSICKYQPNEYYKQLDTYLKNGWRDEGSCVVKKHCSIAKGCFENKETSYVLAFVEYNPQDGYTDLRSVADRLLGLSGKDRDDFFTVYKLVDDEFCERFQA